MRDTALSWVIIDCRDPDRLARFWGPLLGVEVTGRRGPYVFLERTASGIALGFQRVERPSPGKNRIHVDLVADDLPSVVGEVERRGGRRETDYAEGGFLVLSDPEGNVFCLLPRDPWELDETGHAHYPHPEP